MTITITHTGRKVKYLNNRDLLAEIHKSKCTYSSFIQPDYKQYDIILTNLDKVNAKAIAEAKAYLANTDYKMLPNYVPKVDEDLDAIIVKRNETREFIRSNNA